jgi:hypothetical protein
MKSIFEVAILKSDFEKRFYEQPTQLSERSIQNYGQTNTFIASPTSTWNMTAFQFPGVTPEIKSSLTMDNL